MPEDWLDRVRREIDFDAAYDALEGYEHFHTSALRGKLRLYQRRFDEARQHLFQAEELYRSGASPRLQDRVRYFYLKSYHYECALCDEVQCNGPKAETDIAFRQLIETVAPDLLIVLQVRSFAIGQCALHRQRYEDALETFSALLEEGGDRVDHTMAFFYAGHAAAAWELGQKDIAERSYENAALATGLAETPYSVCLYAMWLYLLSAYWGRESEAERWRDLLLAQPGSTKSKNQLLERAELTPNGVVPFRVIPIGQPGDLLLDLESPPL